MKRLLMFIPALAFMLAACESLTEESTLRPVEYTCATATELLKSADTLRGQMKLSPGAIVAIDEAVEVLNPTCGSPNPPTLSNAAATAMSTALTKLTDAVRGAQK
jgi:hypothetical protein